MPTNTATKFLPIVSDEQKIDVTLEKDEAVIRLSTWTEDLGWCTQKTLRIDADMLEDLHRVIASARYRRNAEHGEEKDIQSGKVLEFPNVS